MCTSGLSVTVLGLVGGALPRVGGETPRDDYVDDLLVSYRTLAANCRGFATEASSYGTLLGHTHCQFAAAAQAPAICAATCATSPAVLQK